MTDRRIGTTTGASYMQKKKITLEDGRYLVYYSFEKTDKPEEKGKDGEKCCAVSSGGKK